MTTEKESFANMSPSETTPPVLVEHTSSIAPDPMTAAVQTPICVSGPSTRTSMGEADARRTELVMDFVKRKGTVHPTPEEKKEQ